MSVCVISLVCPPLTRKKEKNSWCFEERAVGRASARGLQQSTPLPPHSFFPCGEARHTHTHTHAHARPTPHTPMQAQQASDRLATLRRHLGAGGDGGRGACVGEEERRGPALFSMPMRWQESGGGLRRRPVPPPPRPAGRHPGDGGEPGAPRISTLTSPHAHRHGRRPGPHRRDRRRRRRPPRRWRRPRHAHADRLPDGQVVRRPHPGGRRRPGDRPEADQGGRRWGGAADVRPRVRFFFFGDGKEKTTPRRAF